MSLSSEAFIFKLNPIKNLWLLATTLTETSIYFFCASDNPPQWWVHRSRWIASHTVCTEMTPSFRTNHGSADRRSDLLSLGGLVCSCCQDLPRVSSASPLTHTQRSIARWSRQQWRPGRGPTYWMCGNAALSDSRSGNIMSVANAARYQGQGRTT